MQEQPELCYVSLKKGCPFWYSNLWTERRNSAAETEKCKFDINKHVHLSITNFTNIQEHLCPVLLSTPCKYKQFSFQKSVFRLKFWVAWLPIQEFSFNSPFLFTESNKKEKPFVFSFEQISSLDWAAWKAWISLLHTGNLCWCFLPWKSFPGIPQRALPPYLELRPAWACLSQSLGWPPYQWGWYGERCVLSLSPAPHGT